MFNFFKKKIKELQAINLEINEGKAVLEKIEADKGALELELQHIQGEKDSFTKKIEELNQVYDVSANNIEIIKKELKNIEQEKHRLMSEQYELADINNKLCDEKKQLEKKTQDLQEANKELEERIRELQEVGKGLEEGNRALEGRTQELQETNKRLEECNQGLEQKAKELQEEANELEGRTQELREVNKEQEEDNQILEERAQELKETNKRLEEGNQGLEQKAKELQEEANGLEGRTQELQEANKELEENNQRLGERTQELQEENQRLEQKAQELQEKANELEGKTQELQEANKELEENNQRLGERTQELQEANKRLEEENQRLEQKAQELQEKANELEGRTGELQEKANELQENINRGQEELSILQHQSSNLSEAIKQDKEAHEAYKNEVKCVNKSSIKSIVEVSSTEKVIEEKPVVEEEDELLRELIESIFGDQEEIIDAVEDTQTQDPQISNEIQQSELDGIEEAEEVQETLVEGLSINHEKSKDDWIYDLEDQEWTELPDEEEKLNDNNDIDEKFSLDLAIQGKSLESIEAELEKLFREVELIGSIYLSKDDYNYLKQSLIEGTKDISGTSLKIKYSNCIALYMVYIAIYDYDNSYWEYVEECFQEVGRTTLMNIFMGVLDRFKLPNFNQYENALKNVTPILCHSGIPHKCMYGLLQVIEELGNRGEGVLIGKEAFKELLNERVDKPVTRYIDYLGKDWETFLLECEEALQSSEIKTYEVLMAHMAYFILAWKSQDEEIVKEKKTKILMPRVCIDPDGIGVYMLLPEQKFYQKDMSRVNWQITTELDEERTTEVDLHYNGTYYFTKEIRIPLKEVSEIEVVLKVDGSTYRTWHMKHLDEDFIAFNGLGELVGQDISGQKEHIVLLKKPYGLKNTEIIVESLDELPNWPSYKGYKVNIQDVAYIYYGKSGYAGEGIQVKKDMRPLLFGGHYLFGSRGMQTTANYIKLPELIMYDLVSRDEWHRLKVVIQSEECNKEKTLAEVRDQIHLRENAISLTLEGDLLIPRNCFGHYDVKLYKDKKIVGKVQFNYVPYIPSEIYPHNNKNAVYYRFKVKNNYELEFEDSTLGSERALDSEQVVQLWKFTTQGQTVEGKLTYNSQSGKSISFRIDKQIRPLSWGILQLSSISTFKWSNKVNTISLENIKNHNDYYLVIEGEKILKSERINLILEDADHQVIKYINGLRRKEKAMRMRIHLTEFIDILEGRNADDCTLKLQCYSAGGKEEYPIICFQEKLVLNDLKCIETNDKLAFIWNQEGGLTQREIMLYSINRPWEKPIIKSVADGACGVEVLKTEIYQGQYGLLISYEKDEWGFDEEEEKCDLSKLPIVEVKQDRPYEPITAVERELYQIINNKSMFMMKSLSLQNIEKEEINKIFKAIIVVGENSKCYGNQVVERLIEASENIVIKNIESYFKFILEANLSPERFIYYCTAFDLYNQLLIQGIDLNHSQLQKLWQINPMLGMLISLQMKDINKEYAMEKILKYVGRQGMNNLLPKVNIGCEENKSVDGRSHLFDECLKLSLWQECYCKNSRPNLSQALIGDKEEIRNYFGHMASTWEVAATKKRRAQMKSQQILEENTASIFLGKTYLETIIEMRKENAQYIQKVSDKVRQVLKMKLSSIKEFMQTGKHAQVLKLLMQRIEEGQQAEYWCGVIAYLQACESLGIQENVFTSYQSQELTRILSEQMNALYERDRVLFQIYLIMEG